MAKTPTQMGVWSVPSTVTVNAEVSGSAASSWSSVPSKVMVSAEPLTAAEEKTGGVLLVTAW